VGPLYALNLRNVTHHGFPTACKISPFSPDKNEPWLWESKNNIEEGPDQMEGEWDPSHLTFLILFCFTLSVQPLHLELNLDDKMNLLQLLKNGWKSTPRRVQYRGDDYWLPWLPPWEISNCPLPGPGIKMDQKKNIYKKKKEN
jgi:hypothetical protein